eukprot:m.147987 g.147987  ORF g.147987 m.147987 type:complete len:525 (-) comp11666_c0_seq20:537-2111(-)
MHYVRIASYTSSILYETPSPRFVWWLITCRCMACAYDSCISVLCAGTLVATFYLTMDPPPEGWKGTCILEWCNEDVRAWLNYKRWEAYFPEPVPDGEMLAIRTQNRFKRDIKDDGVAQDIFDAITVNLKLSRKKRLFDKDVLETIIEERSTPVTQPQPPQQDASAADFSTAQKESIGRIVKDSISAGFAGWDNASGTSKGSGMSKMTEEDVQPFVSKTELQVPEGVDDGRVEEIVRLLKQLELKHNRYSIAPELREMKDIEKVFAPTFKKIVGIFKDIKFFCPASGRDLTLVVGLVTKKGKPDATIGVEEGLTNSLMEFEFKSGMTSRGEPRTSLQDKVPQAVAEAVSMSLACLWNRRYVILTCGHRFVVVMCEMRDGQPKVQVQISTELVLPEDKQTVAMWLDFLLNDCVERLASDATVSRIFPSSLKRSRSSGGSGGGSAASGGNSGAAGARGTGRGGASGKKSRRGGRGRGRGSTFKVPHKKKTALACDGGGELVPLTADALLECTPYGTPDLRERVFRLV